jgi:type VI secretion system FHA domain protein
MALMLEVVGPHAQSMGANARRVLGDQELRIGREPDNDWVFPQSYVSRRQAVIRCVNGMYFLEQIGTCPVAVNDPSRVIERNRIVRLSGGDRVLIDDIEIRLLEVEGAAAPGIASAPDIAPAVALPSGVVSPMPLIREEPTVSVSAPPNAALDPLVILGITPAAAPARQPPPPDLPKQNSPLQFALPDAPRSTAPPSGGPGLTANWWSQGAPAAAAPQSVSAGPGAAVTPGAAAMPGAPATPATPAARPPPAAVMPRPMQPAPAAPPYPAAASPALVPSLREILRGAGLDAEAQLAPEVALQLGEALRIVVEGTMQVLQARNNIRREFRLPTTQVARKDNNPLKFSADASDALHKLLVQRSAAYMDTVSAFDDAFDDIRAHQVAMLEALRSAFDHMLRQFDPEVLGTRLAQRGTRGSVLGLGKPNLWELYGARFQEWTADRDFAFRQLFGEEFGKAYEQNLEKQKRMLKDKTDG